MKAVTIYTYGNFDNIKLKDVEKPKPSDNEVLVKMVCSSVNYANVAHVKGKPFLIRLWLGISKPTKNIIGGDISGYVEGVGKDVSKFKIGDTVFGDNGDDEMGAFAEYVCVNQNNLVHKPSNVSFEAAAGCAQSAVVALQGLRDKGELKEKQKVLICGASGGIGIYAVQIAKALGGEVTAVCGSKNLELMESLGANHVIDYQKEDFVKNGIKYDLIIAIAGFRSIFKYKSILSKEGTYVTIGGKMKQIFQAILLGPLLSFFGKQKFTNLTHKVNREDLRTIGNLLESGTLKTQIDNVYDLENVKDAIFHYDNKSKSGKIIIRVSESKINDK